MNREAKFNLAVCDLMLSVPRARTVETFHGSHKWEMDTKYGLMTITLHEPEPRNTIFSVFLRFISPEKPKELDCNPYTGKWNVHTRTAHGALDALKNKLKGVSK